MITFPGDLDGSLNSDRLLRVSRALLQNCSSWGHRQHLPRGPRHPWPSPTYFTEGDFFPPHPLFPASKRTCWETLKEFLWVCWGRGWVGWVLAVEIVCINFFFCETEQNLLPFHSKAAGAGKHSQHEQAQCSFTVPVCMDGFINFTPTSYQENLDLTLLNWIF